MTTNRASLIPILEASGAVIAWGASFVATKVALAYLVPAAVVWLRFAIGVIILGFAVGLRRQFALPARHEILYMAGVGFLGITLHQWLQSTALLTTSAGNSAWIVATAPIFMALLGWMVLREKLTWRQVVGIVVAAAGVVLVVSKGDLRRVLQGGSNLVGDGLVLISALNWAVFSTLSTRGLQRHPATRLMFYMMGFGWLFISVPFVIGNGLSQIRGVPLDGWLAVGFLGVFCSGLAYIFWFDALQKLSVAQTGAFIYFEPLVTVIVAAWVLADPFGLPAAIGGAAILLGVWLVNHAN